MFVVLFVVLLFSNFLCYISGKQSRFLWMLAIVYFGMVFVFGSCNYGDRLEYYLFFSSVNSLRESQFEIGYVAVNLLLKSFGLSFSAFLAICYIAGSCLIWHTVGNFGANINLTVVLYGLYLLIYCCVTIRFFLAISMVVFGFSFLMRNKRVTFLICTIIAVLIHSSTIFFIPLALFRNNKEERIHYILPVIVIVLTLIIALDENFVFLFLRLAILVFPWMEHRLMCYVHINEAHYGLILFLLFPLLGFLCTCTWKKKSKYYCHDDSMIVVLNLLYYVGLLALFTMPLIVMDGDFMRISLGCEFLFFACAARIYGKDTRTESALYEPLFSIDKIYMSMLLVIGILSFYVIKLNGVSVFSFIQNMSFPWCQS